MSQPRRWKVHHAQSGYVYQYVLASAGPGLGEYRFEVAAGPGAAFPVTVVVRAEQLPAWTREPGCALDAPYYYAIAKLSLTQAFDEHPDPGGLGPVIEPDAESVAAILEMLGAG